MGMSWLDFQVIARLHQQGYIPARRRIIEIGAQQLSDNFLRRRPELQEFGRSLGVTTPHNLPAPARDHHAEGQEFQLPEAPRTRQVWEWLGYEYAAIDIDGSPGSIPLDLNFDRAPLLQRKKFDLVTNYGTTEHIANQLNAFRVIHDLTKVGGVMVHRLPTQGYITHGLMNYDPKFFWMLARSNGYKWLFMDFEAYPQSSYKMPDSVPSMIRPFANDVDARLAGYDVVDCALGIALQKVVNIPFVPPLDAPTGLVTEDRHLKRRYWTVVQYDKFQRKIVAEQKRDENHARRTRKIAAFLNRIYPPLVKIAARGLRLLRR
jgi:SAM-dependent methyltransferase